MVPREESNATRGARNVVTRCLCIAPQERVHLLAYHAESVYDTMASAIEAADGVPVRIDLAAIYDDSASVPHLVARLAPVLSGATATILLAPDRIPGALSMAVARAAEKQGARHLHLLQVDERMLGQSLRAEPELLGIVNERLRQALRPPCQIKITSESGTDLEVRLTLAHPIMASSGRPARGDAESLPAGFVYAHPARVSGLLVVDRAIFGPEMTIDRAAVRRSPARLRFNGTRVSEVDAPDPAIARALEAYLASHGDAARVGTVVFPTNYLVRSDVGLDRQDMLLPGMSVSLGQASSETIHASYDALVQLVLLGRRQTVEVSGRKLVEAGRLDDALVDGIDPFR